MPKLEMRRKTLIHAFVLLQLVACLCCQQRDQFDQPVRSTEDSIRSLKESIIDQFTRQDASKFSTEDNCYFQVYIRRFLNLTELPMKVVTNDSVVIVPGYSDVASYHYVLIQGLDQRVIFYGQTDLRILEFSRRINPGEIAQYENVALNDILQFIGTGNTDISRGQMLEVLKSITLNLYYRRYEQYGDVLQHAFTATTTIENIRNMYGEQFNQSNILDRRSPNDPEMFLALTAPNLGYAIFRFEFEGDKFVHVSEFLAADISGGEHLRSHSIPAEYSHCK